MESDWEKHQAQLEQIAADSKRQLPIGPVVPLEELRCSIPAELLLGFDAIIKRNYKGIRRIRGDVRLSSENKVVKLTLLQKMKDSIDDLCKSGYQRLSVETFQEMLVELFEDEAMTPETVDALFGDVNESQHIVWYARLLCAGYLKQNAERFLPFLGDAYYDVGQFCAAEVEPVGREADEIHIIALCEYLNVEFAIEYLTQGAGVMAAPTKFEPLKSPPLCKVSLLYRVGHYDLLLLE